MSGSVPLGRTMFMVEDGTRLCAICRRDLWKGLVAWFWTTDALCHFCGWWAAEHGLRVTAEPTPREYTSAR